MAETKIDWAAIAKNPKFVELHHRKTSFLYGWWAFSAGSYFLLLLGAGYTPGLFSIEVFGNINVGYLFALFQFVITFVIAIHYGRVADRDAVALPRPQVAEEARGHPAAEHRCEQVERIAVRMVERIAVHAYPHDGNLNP